VALDPGANCHRNRVELTENRRAACAACAASTAARIVRRTCRRAISTNPEVRASLRPGRAASATGCISGTAVETWKTATCTARARRPSSEEIITKGLSKVETQASIQRRARLERGH
jgi:hypothetical protein